MATNPILLTHSTVLACVIDITTALIPAFLLWDLQLKRKTKFILNAIFFLGFLTASLSIARAATTNASTYDSDLTCMFLLLFQSKLILFLYLACALPSCYSLTLTIIQTLP